MPRQSVELHWHLFEFGWAITPPGPLCIRVCCDCKRQGQSAAAIFVLNRNLPGPTTSGVICGAMKMTVTVRVCAGLLDSRSKPELPLVLDLPAFTHVHVLCPVPNNLASFMSVAISGDTERVTRYVARRSACAFAAKLNLSALIAWIKQRGHRAGRKEPRGLDCDWNRWRINEVARINPVLFGVKFPQ